MMNEETLLNLLAQNPIVTYLAALGVLLPYLFALIYRSRWSPEVKGLLTVAGCFVAAALWLVIHTWSTSAWVVYGVALLGLTQVIYWAMKPALTALERRTG